MANYIKLQDAIDAGTTNMICLRNNSRNDDGTTTYATDINWFKFNGVVMSNIYSSGNSWLGLGVSSEQLKINRRDTAVWYEYKETGLIGITKFFKFRWCGYSQYSTTASDCYLAYDWFFFDNGQIFLNYYNVPTGYFTNSNNLICGSQNIGFTSNAGVACEYTFTPSDVLSGTGWSISNVRPPVDVTYKMNGSANFIVTNYNIGGNDRVYWTADIPDETSLVISIKVGSGNYNIVSNGDLIPNLPLSGDTTIYIKAELSTTNNLKTPKLSNLWIYNNEHKKIIVLNLNIPDISPAIGDVSVVYDGNGGLMGYGGPVSNFNKKFTPTGVWKGNQNDEEHIEVRTNANILLNEIIYHSVKSIDEHIEIFASANYTLTDIHDI